MGVVSPHAVGMEKPRFYEAADRHTQHLAQS